jgi:dTDP-4-dehydrorhamnose 3,5-epimerase
MVIEPTEIPGCLLLRMDVRRDARGFFVKTFQRGVFNAHGLATEYAEEFYSASRQNVLRGLHFQLPPHDHVKLVGCVDGEVLDAVLDLRGGSPTYGKHVLVRLAADEGVWLYLPCGLAHGFYTVSPTALMAYKTSTAHAPAYDAGLLWNSAGIPWPCEAPILSDRDRQHMPFAKFMTPFVYSACFAGREP